MILEWKFKELEYPNKLLCDNGECWNLKNGKKLKLKKNFGGYWRLRVYNKGKESYKWIHRLVYSTFVGTIPKSYEIHHLDRDPTNNHYLNLLATSPQNHRKKFHYKNKQKEEDSVDCPF